MCVSHLYVITPQLHCEHIRSHTHLLSQQYIDGTTVKIHTWRYEPIPKDMTFFFFEMIG